MLVQLVILNNFYRKYLNLVSVIVITKNHSKYLSKCIDSILNQTYKKFELVIIDHDSTDNTYEIVNSYKSEKIKYLLYKEKKNISAVRNFGIKNSIGNYIFFTDADCIVARNWIEEGLNILDKDEVSE